MLNQIILIGRLTKDVESKELDNGLKIVTFSLAINQGKDDYVEFIDCTAREHLHKVVTENLVKGDKVAVIGQFANPSFTDKNGVKKNYPKIYVDSIEFIDVLKFNQPKEETKPEPKPEPKAQGTRRR